MTLTFGIYAGGLATDPDGRVTPGPPEDPGAIAAALDELRLPLVRAYLLYPTGFEAPPDPWRYATGGRKLDLVVCFREPGDDLTGWLRHLRGLVREHGA